MPDVSDGRSSVAGRIWRNSKYCLLRRSISSASSIRRRQSNGPVIGSTLSFERDTTPSNVPELCIAMSSSDCPSNGRILFLAMSVILMYHRHRWRPQRCTSKTARGWLFLFFRLTQLKALFQVRIYSCFAA